MASTYTTSTADFEYNTTDNTTPTVTPEIGWTKPPFDVSANNVVLAIVLTTLDIVTLFGNLLVLVSFMVEKRLLHPFNMFILNLAVTDFSVAITAMTFYTLDTLLGYWPFGRIMCGIWIYFDFAMTFASVFTLVAISIDRFWCVTWVIHYKLHNNRKRTAIILGIIWICVISIWTPPFIGDRLKRNDDHSCIWEPSDNTEFVIFVAVIGHYIPCIVMVFCYFKVFYVMKRRSQLVGNNIDRVPSTTATSRQLPIHATNFNTSSTRHPAGSSKSDDTAVVSNFKSNTLNPSFSGDPRRSPLSQIGVDHNEGRVTGSRERRIFITLTYVLSSYLICWFPFYIAFDMYAWRPELVPNGLYTFFFWMTYVNSTLNPFIYAYTSKEFRQAFVKVLQLLYRCK